MIPCEKKKPKILRANEVNGNNVVFFAPIKSNLRSKVKNTITASLLNQCPLVFQKALAEPPSTSLYFPYTISFQIVRLLYLLSSVSPPSFGRQGPRCQPPLNPFAQFVNELSAILVRLKRFRKCNAQPSLRGRITTPRAKREVINLSKKVSTAGQNSKELLEGNGAELWSEWKPDNKLQRQGKKWLLSKAFEKSSLE